MAEEKIIPVYDPCAAPVMDLLQIEEILPQRPPFLFVDRIVEQGDNYVVGVKMVTGNEPFFQGHFPGQPVMPGVLIVEAMGQTGGILIGNYVDDPKKYNSYFTKFDNVKFRGKVVPGDVLLCKLTITDPLRHTFISMHGEAYVGKTKVCSADMTVQVIRKKE